MSEQSCQVITDLSYVGAGMVP